MLCHSCGTDVGDSLRLCHGCKNNQAPVLEAQSSAIFHPRNRRAGAYYSGRNASMEPAGFWLRFFALLIDSMLMGIISWVICDLLLRNIFKWSLHADLEALISEWLGALTNGSSSGLPGASGLMELILVGMLLRLMVLAVIQAFTLVTIGLLYFPAFESSKLAATPGKWALGLRVTNLEDQPVSFSSAVTRHLSKVISFFSFGIGFLMVGFTAQKQALHDILAKCLVQKDPLVSSERRFFAAIASAIFFVLWIYLSPDSKSNRTVAIRKSSSAHQWGSMDRRFKRQDSYFVR